MRLNRYEHDGPHGTSAGATAKGFIETTVLHSKNSNHGKSEFTTTEAVVWLICMIPFLLALMFAEWVCSFWSDANGDWITSTIFHLAQFLEGIAILCIIWVVISVLFFKKKVTL